MSERTLTISYPEELLLSLKESPAEFEAEARLLLATKLYELGRVTTGMASKIAGLTRVAFMIQLARFRLSPIGTAPDEVQEELDNA